MHRIVRCIAAGAFIAGLAPPASACSCVSSEIFDRPCVAFAGQVVFAGRVLGIEDGVELVGEGEKEYRRTIRHVRFDVEEAFRGLEGRTAEVRTGTGGGDCGFGFEVGQRYLVYANADPSSGFLYTGLCSSTRRLGDAAQDLDFGRQFKGGQTATWILGSAFHRRATADGVGSEPLIGARIRARGPGGASGPTRTDDQGNFELQVVAGGRWVVEAEAGEGVPPVPPVTVEVEKGTCAAIWLEADSLARMEGRIRNLAGDPVAETVVTLRPAGGSDPPPAQQAWTNREGRFAFRRLIPGSYFLVVNDRASAELPPRVFFPGTQDPARAEVLTLEPGEQRDLGDLDLPRGEESAAVRGLIEESRTEPSYRLQVQARSGNEPPFFPKLEDSGAFSFQGIAGRTYRLQACLLGDPVQCGPAVEVVAGSQSLRDRAGLKLPGKAPLPQEEAGEDGPATDPPSP